MGTTAVVLHVLFGCILTLIGVIPVVRYGFTGKRPYRWWPLIVSLLVGVLLLIAAMAGWENIAAVAVLIFCLLAMEMPYGRPSSNDGDDDEDRDEDPAEDGDGGSGSTVVPDSQPTGVPQKRSPGTIGSRIFAWYKDN